MIKDINRLIEVLETTKELLVKYDNISWEGLSPAEVGMDLEISIEKLKNNESIDKEYLKSLYAPTGLIQDCSIANDWTVKYLELSQEFDSLIDGVK